MNQLFRPPVEPLVLRPYQEEAVSRCREVISSWTVVNGVRRRARPVLSAPTGAGKTAIASAIFASARARGRTCAFVVPLLSLLPQTWRAFERVGIDHMGVMQGDNELTDASAPVQLCSIQTIGRRQPPRSQVVLFDEIHVFHEAHKRWMAEAPPETVFIGLSATPWRKGLGDHFDGMIVVETLDGLIHKGYLSPYRAFAPTSPGDLSGVKKTAGDFNEKQLGEHMNKPKLVADVVNTWIEKAEGRPTLVFGVDCAHAKSLQEQFLAAGVKAGYADAYTPVEGPGGREDQIAQMARGDLNLICNVGTMTTGVDAPFVSCISLARPTQSEMLYIQIIGRGLRTAPGKKDCLLLDHSDTIGRLGLPEEIFYGSFVTGKENGSGDSKEEKKERLPKPCPQCSYMLAPGTRVCPSCGTERKVTSTIQCEEGELQEIGVGKKKKTKEEADMATKQRWFSGLLWIAEERGYKSGWADNKYRAKFGVWPRLLEHKPAYPDAVVFSWVKSQAISWAKSRNNPANAGGS